MRIGVISDTHSYLDPKVFKYFEACEQVWHAGDIGLASVSDQLAQRFELKAVYGNIDGTDLRKQFKEDLFFEVEGKKILMTHIAGKPGSYNQRVAFLLKELKPDILVCGHSHILRVEFDKKYNVLFMNPGAAGIHGFHKVKTLLRFEITAGEIKHMQVIEMGPRIEIPR
ncbi:MAG TPA: metallophosphoesterase family protein [Flavobacteriales bacterium]|nr:metallophosphoesterase family protein [Flavobacteriales bacterium]